MGDGSSKGAGSYAPLRKLAAYYHQDCPGGSDVESRRSVAAALGVPGQVEQVDDVLVRLGHYDLAGSRFRSSCGVVDQSERSSLISTSRMPGTRRDAELLGSKSIAGP